MSGVSEKKEGGAAPQHPQQVPGSGWYNNPPAMNMYNMYNPYMYPQGYGAQNYYPYYQHGMQNFMNHGNPTFTPGGHLLPFQQGVQQQQQQQQQTPTQSQNNTNNSNDANDDLPPLPPGPPPSKDNATNPGATPQNNFSSNAVIQSGPVKFMMNNARQRMNVPGNPFQQQQQNQNQAVSGASTNPKRANKKKKKKQKQQQIRQQQMMLQQQMSGQFHWQKPQQGQATTDNTPPLPDAPPPPLPPGTPPPPPPPPTAGSTEPKENHSSVANTHFPPNPPAVLQPYQGPMPPLPPSNPVQNQGIKALDDWPPSLRDYVSRCYAKCVTQMDKDRVGVILKGKLIRATTDDTLWSKDWTAEPLPLLDSDSKAVMNLKEKMTRASIASRLGPKTASPSRKRPSLPSRGSTRSSYRSGSSSSRSSRSSSSSRRSRSRSPRTKKSSRNTSKKGRGNHNNNNNNKRSNSFNSKSHFYSEYGIIGGSEDLNVKKEVLDKRAARFSTPNTNKGPTLSSSISNRLGTKEGPRKKMNAPFVYDTGPSSPLQNGPSGDFEVSDLHIIGTCEDLEKAYLRLTSAPEASQVRPRNVLMKSLEMVKAKWIKDRDYRYAFEQLKSIRQDLTVQGIRDALSVEVYETHARIAMEMKDHAEFNQCQSQLRLLHDEVTEANENQKEFKAYGLIYFILTKDFMELSTMISLLTPEDKKDECIRHAVDLSRAWLIGNYDRVMKLYKTAPKMSSYLMDLFINRERVAYFKVLMKAYRPSIPLDFVKSELELDTDTEVEEFLTSVGNVSFVDSSRTLIDCKAFQG